MLFGDMTRTFREQAEELERRLVAAEEQAAAAWSMCAALQKEVKDLREGISQEFLENNKAIGRVVGKLTIRIAQEIDPSGALGKALAEAAESWE